MKFIIGQDRYQIPLFASSIEAAIAQDNEIRLIDMFVDSIKLAGFGFKMDFIENATMAIVLPHSALLRKIGNFDFSTKPTNYYNLT